MAKQPLKSNRFEFLFGIIVSIFVIAFWMMWGPSENAPVAVEENPAEVEMSMWEDGQQVGYGFDSPCDWDADWSTAPPPSSSKKLDRSFIVISGCDEQSSYCWEF